MRPSQIGEIQSRSCPLSPSNETVHSLTRYDRMTQSEISNSYYRSPTRESENQNLIARDSNTAPNMSTRDSAGERQKSTKNGHLDAYTNAPRPLHASPKAALAEKPNAGTEKLGTLSGVFVPTSLNVISILMFLRFGFILGQSGFLGMMGKFIRSGFCCYST